MNEVARPLFVFRTSTVRRTNSLSLNAPQPHYAHPGGNENQLALYHKPHKAGSRTGPNPPPILSGKDELLYLNIVPHDDKN